MILIHTIFLFLLFSLFFLPQWLHRKRHPFMRRYYLRMTALPTARKLYRLVLLIVLFVFHFLYLTAYGNDIGVVVSTIAFAIFFCLMDVDKWLHRLHEERKPFRITVVSILVFAFVPHLFTLAVTAAFILLASLFYPSRRIMSLWHNKDDRKVLVEDMDMLTEYYY